MAPMWTPPISESAELTQWSLYIKHDSENNPDVPVVGDMVVYYGIDRLSYKECYLATFGE